MKIKPIAVVAAIAALAVPATAASAHSGKGRSGHDHAKREAKAPESRHHHDRAKETARGHAKKPKNAVFKGVVVSVDEATGAVTVQVKKASRWGRAFKGQDVAFDVSKLRKAVTVAAGDKVLVLARIRKDDAAPFVARRLHRVGGCKTDRAKHPEKPEAPEKPETPEQPETPEAPAA